MLFGRGTVFNEDFDAGDLSRIESLRKISGQASGFRDSDAFFGTVALSGAFASATRSRSRATAPSAATRSRPGTSTAGRIPTSALLESWRRGPVAARRARGASGPGAGRGRDRERARPGAEGAPGDRPRRSPQRRRPRDRRRLARRRLLFVLRAFWPYRTIRAGRQARGGRCRRSWRSAPCRSRRSAPRRWKERVPGLDRVRATDPSCSDSRGRASRSRHGGGGNDEASSRGWYSCSCRSISAACGERLIPPPRKART